MPPVTSGSPKPYLPSAKKFSVQSCLLIHLPALSSGRRLFCCAGHFQRTAGVLDASECPPTFRTHLTKCKPSFAGGHEKRSGARWKARKTMRCFWSAGDPNLRDHPRAMSWRVIAASGRAPFVWGAVERGLDGPRSENRAAGI